jgi:hypothetical protein
LILVISTFDATAVTEPNIAKLTKSGLLSFQSYLHLLPYWASVNPTLGRP